MSQWVDQLKLKIKKVSHWHRPSDRPNVFVMATPRGGSTWMMELVCSQPGFRQASEPFNLRIPRIKQHLGVDDWSDLYNDGQADTVKAYMADLAANRVTFQNTVPGRRFYRFKTDRTVFKLIHGAEHLVPWMTEALNGVAVILLRHPIPVSLSRKVLPRLEAYVRSDYAQHFSDAQLALAERIIREGTHLDKGVLSWCFQQSVPLRSLGDRVVAVTYEQIVLEPEKVVAHLTEKLALPYPDRMAKQVKVASTTVKLSSQQSAAAIQQGDRAFMVSKWRQEVDEDYEAELIKILDAFEIDAYRFGEQVSQRFWLRD